MTDSIDIRLDKLIQPSAIALSTQDETEYIVLAVLKAYQRVVIAEANWHTDVAQVYVVSYDHFGIGGRYDTLYIDTEEAAEC